MRFQYLLILFLTTFSLKSFGITVLSYNICWECMTGSAVGTGGPLGARCGESKEGLSNCLLNLTDLLNEIIAHYGHGAPFDFIAFQEATNWPEIYKRSPFLRNLYYTSFSRGSDSFVTFYNPKKFSLVHDIKGGFVPNSRPFQILIFSEGYIFVNLHNDHKLKPDQVEKALSESLKIYLRREKISPSNFTNYRIILAGDFNDGDYRNYLNFMPFKSAGITTTVSIQGTSSSVPLKSSPNYGIPENTCCSTALPWTAFRPGDYIMDSLDPRKSGVSRIPIIKIPSNHNKVISKPISDHAPVIYQSFE